MTKYIIIAIIALIVVVYIVIQKANDIMIFHPQTYTRGQFLEEIKVYGDNVIPFTTTSDDVVINGVFYNAHNKPNMDEKILVYSYGNAGTILNALAYDLTLNDLSDHYTICLYDYRGYGASTGSASEEGLYNDLYAVIKYILDQNIDPKNVIMMGHSLGSSISSHVAYRLLKENIKPKGLILQAGFSDISDIAYDLFGILNKFVTMGFNNYTNIKLIDNEIPVYILHSKNDEMIKYKHAKKLESTKKCSLITIEGGHNDIKYNDKVKKLFAHLAE